jgi:erythronate-4-phosphate dehydrogenase
VLKIVADHKIPFLKGALEQVAQVEYLPGSKITREHLLDADVLIVRTRTKCNSALLDGTKVRFIASATIGYDHIDTEYCASQGIQWTNAPGCNSGSVKQYIASSIAAITTRDQKKFSDITMGIVGVGNVGSKIHQLCRAIGIKTILNDPPRQRNENNDMFSDLEYLLQNSDIVTMHVPLIRKGDDMTFHMVNEWFLSKMKKGAWLINSSRGEIAMTNALKDAVMQNHLSGVVLDVWESEPLIDEELLHLAYIATPHIAGYSADGKANGTAMSVQAISRFFNLGMDNWCPQTIPVPANIPIKVNEAEPEKIFQEISLGAYNIFNDSALLKSSPESFELQRENYPIRREPHALPVLSENTAHEFASQIKNLGYLLTEK